MISIYQIKKLLSRTAGNPRWQYLNLLPGKIYVRMESAIFAYNLPRVRGEL